MTKSRYSINVSSSKKSQNTDSLIIILKTRKSRRARVLLHFCIINVTFYI